MILATWKYIAQSTYHSHSNMVHCFWTVDRYNVQTSSSGCNISRDVENIYLTIRTNIAPQNRTTRDMIVSITKRRTTWRHTTLHGVTPRDVTSHHVTSRQFHVTSYLLTGAASPGLARYSHCFLHSTSYYTLQSSHKPTNGGTNNQNKRREQMRGCNIWANRK